MPALGATRLAYINRVIALIQETVQGADIDVECQLVEQGAAGDLILKVSPQESTRFRTGVCTVRNVSAGTTENLTITQVADSKGRIRVAAPGLVAAYGRGDRVTQSYTQSGRTPVQTQPDTVPVKDMANCLQMLTDICDVTVAGALTATGGSTTTVVDTNALVNVNTGLTACVGATITVVIAATATTESRTIVGCPNVNTFTVSPPFTGIVAAGDTYSIDMDQIDDQIQFMLDSLPHGATTPDAPALNPSQFWYTVAAAIVHFNDQLATGMTGATAFTDPQIESLRGALRSYPQTSVALDVLIAATTIQVSDISLFDVNGGTIRIGRGTANDETIAYTNPALVDQPGRPAVGGGPVSTGSRLRGGRGQLTVAAGLASAHSQGELVEITAVVDHAAVSTAITPTHPAPPNADELKQFLPTLLTQLRDTVGDAVNGYVLPT